MPIPTAARTLVKSPPELWAEVADDEALARHLGAFGSIRITRTEPGRTVAWEGDRARGTVLLEPAGWGTKVTLEAEPIEPAPPVAVAAVPAGPTPDPDPDAAVRPRWWQRLLRRRFGATAPADAAATVPADADEPVPDVVIDPVEPLDHEAVLVAVLDDLGGAHRRPFSRI